MSYFRDKGLQAARTIAKKPSEWSPRQIALVRQMAAQGASAAAVAEALGGDIAAACVRARAAKLGIRFVSKRAHMGKPVGLSQGTGMTFHDPYSARSKRHVLAWIS